MEDVAVIGLDLAKSVFQVHGIDRQDKVVLRQRLSRAKLLPFFAKLPRCLVGMETCASANYWARELIALGHEVRLMPPQYVKPYVKRSKNDASDAEAICEAVTRPTMRFVGVKPPEQQSVLVLHRTRSILTRQRTQIGNAMRAHLAEFGIVAPVGRQGLDRLIAVIGDESDGRLPQPARACLAMLVDQYRLVLVHLLEPDRAIRADSRATELGRRLQEIPGVGPLVASALVATVPDPHVFKSGRSLSAWLGLVPRQHSSGGKERQRRSNRSKTWPHPNTAAAKPEPELANGAPSRQGRAPGRTTPIGRTDTKVPMDPGRPTAQTWWTAGHGSSARLTRPRSRRAGNGRLVRDGPLGGAMQAEQQKRGGMDDRKVVALVDDDESVRESLPDLLRSFGFEVVPFASAEAFLAFDGHADCLVLDVAMPGMTGPELQQELARRGSTLPIVFITAHSDEKGWPRLQRSGAVACLLKPFSEDAILDAVRLALRRS